MSELGFGRRKPMIAKMSREAMPLRAEPDRALMARTLAYLFAAGTGIALLSLLLPVGVAEAGEGDFLARMAAVGALATAALVIVLVRGATVIRAWAYHLILAVGTTLISVAVFTSGDAASIHVMFYVLVAFYAAYFFSPGQAGVQVAFVGIAYGSVLLALNDDGETARWLTTVGTLAVATILIGTLKARLERLIERLADAARTDVLTGLLNRRGFEETIELELERARRSGRPLSLIVGDLDRFKELNDRHGHRAGDGALERLAAVLRAEKRRIDTAARVGGEEFAILVPESTEHDAYILAERLRRAVRDARDPDVPHTTISFGIATYPVHGFNAETVFQAADGALYAAKELGRDRTVIHNPEIAAALASTAARREASREGYLATILALAEALDVRDTGTARHSETVARYSELIARELQLPDEVVERVRIGGILHDVGKIGVPDSVLNKPGPLDAADWDEMRTHPLIAARILDSATVEDIRAWVLCHHERPDGTGYPHGLVGEEIPLEARILAVADAYEAMTADRVYRDALSPERARAELVEGSGTQFDAQVVDALLAVIDRKGAGDAAHAA
jgi:diguanylate cyclase (GGDEF)-like protein/putative nucleotidyltransferase with HDIG domain